MRFHSLLSILATAAVHVVAQRLLPRVQDPPLFTASPSSDSLPTDDPAPYWLEDIKHQGISAFHNDSKLYQVFRNVKDFGAQGDGVTDDTEAINAAIRSGGRCAPGSCKSSSTTPAVVYFPAGTYLISESIIDYYYTQIIGNPNSLPLLKANVDFKGFGLIDGDPYAANSGLQYGATDVFYRQIRNMVFDITAVPAERVAYAVHWPTSQATSIQNCIFKMSDAPGTQHQGLFVESGSGGVMSDLTFYGGSKGAFFGNQQFTVLNLKFYNAVTAIDQAWDWGWTYVGLQVSNCTIGLNMATGGSLAQTVGSVTILDSSFMDTDIAIITAHTSSSSPDTAGSLILDNVSVTDVGETVHGPDGILLTGGSKTIGGWGQGHKYGSDGQKAFVGPVAPFIRPDPLTANGRFKTWSKPQYNHLPASAFVSVRSAGAKGDGVRDDTKILNSIISDATKIGKVVFFDAGTYKVTSTIIIPPGSRIVGEAYSVIMGSGPAFSDINSPRAVAMVGTPGTNGRVEWSDMIVSTQGPAAGAILIQWNLHSDENSPSGMWDVHTRIGGFAGSELQLTDCGANTANIDVVNSSCVAALMSIHFTDFSSGVYLENNWFWVADHDLDESSLGRISIYVARGLQISSKNGSFWLIGTSAEHHALYQLYFRQTRDIFASQIQTETAYYQPNPGATVPFDALATYGDYDFMTHCAGEPANCAMGWGLRVVDCESIVVYGAGLYSFFDNYNTACSSVGQRNLCQPRIFSIEGNGGISLYNLNTIGTTAMATQDHLDVVKHHQNVNVFPGTVAYFEST